MYTTVVPPMAHMVHQIHMAIMIHMATQQIHTAIQIHTVIMIHTDMPTIQIHTATALLTHMVAMIHMATPLLTAQMRDLECGHIPKLQTEASSSSMKHCLKWRNAVCHMMLLCKNGPTLHMLLAPMVMMPSMLKSLPSFLLITLIDELSSEKLTPTLKRHDAHLMKL